jgi:hypothetical protein
MPGHQRNEGGGNSWSREDAVIHILTALLTVGYAALLLLLGTAFLRA